MIPDSYAVIGFFGSLACSILLLINSRKKSSSPFLITVKPRGTGIFPADYKIDHPLVCLPVFLFLLQQRLIHIPLADSAVFRYKLHRLFMVHALALVHLHMLL